MLLIISIGLSAGIVAVSVLNARRLFGTLDQSIQQLTRLERGLAGVTDFAKFQEWLKQWPLGQADLATHLVKRLIRICRGRALNGWVIDPDIFCDSKAWLRDEPGYDRIQIMPGMFTGIGILFTFLGLTIGIFGLDPTDPERLTQGVRGLLGGMSMAFLTSIAGIGTALWWTWRTKHYSERYNGIARRITSVLQDKPFLMFPDEIPNKMLDKLSLQNQYLADMENTMTVAFRRALEDQGWIEIQQNIARMVARKDSSELFSQALETLSRNTDGLAESVKQTLGLQQKMLRALEQSGGVGGGGGSVNWDDPNQRAAIIRDTSHLAGNVARIHGAQQDMNKHLLETASTLKELMEHARIANADIILTHKNLTNQLQRLEKHWDGYREQVLAMQKSLRLAIETFQKRLQTTLKTAHGEIDELLGQSLTHFTAALDSFEATIEGFGILLKTGQVGGKKGKWLDKLSS